MEYIANMSKQIYPWSDVKLYSTILLLINCSHIPFFIGEKIIELMWGSCLYVQCVKPVEEGPSSKWALITSHSLLFGTNRIMLNMWSASKTEHSTKVDSIQLQWSLLVWLLHGYTYLCLQWRRIQENANLKLIQPHVASETIWMRNVTRIASNIILLI